MESPLAISRTRGIAPCGDAAGGERETALRPSEEGREMRLLPEHRATIHAGLSMLLMLGVRR
jgi:hypothetical protein